MGSGLSMTSVNKIKELATAREYSLALDIIDSQDLSKSLNPQFIRLCGEVYIANKRYKDARRVLLMAHRMAPEAKRVIYSLVDLYLRMGYKDLAEFYYKLYMFDAEPNLPQTDHMNYIYNKAQGCPHQEIETLLFPMYSDVMDYDWSFELYLLMKIQGKDEEAKAIKSDYVASFKNEPNVLLMEELEQSNDRLEELFYIYSKENVADDAPDQEELRQEEKPLLEADDLRMNPKEAEIQIVFEDNEKATFGAKLKYKKHMKEQEKLARKAEKEAGEEAVDGNPDENVSFDGATEPVSSLQDGELQEPQDTDAADGKMNIFKKLFSRKKNDEIETVEAEAAEGDADIQEKLDVIVTQEESDATEDIETDENSDDVDDADIEVISDVTEDVTEDEIEDEIEDTHVEEIIDIKDDTTEAEEISDSIEENIEENIEDIDIQENIDNKEDAAEDESEYEPLEDIGDSVMQEIYEKKKISIVTELGEDTFINTQDFEQEFDSGNPFEEMLNHDKKSSEDKSVWEETKSSFVFEEVQLQPEDDEYDVDDFSGEFEQSGFDEVEVEAEPEYEAEIEVEAESVYETEIEVETEPEYEVEAEAGAEPEYEAEIEVEAEPEYEAEVEVETEPKYEVEAEVETEPEYEVEVETETEFDAEVMDSLGGESVYKTLKEKGNMDFPEFKTTLFPEYGQEIAEVENNFNEIMSEAQDKINENLLKEEQMQREAEALLASLGIDLGSIKPTIKPEDASLGLENKVENSVSISPTTDRDDVQTPYVVEEQNPELASETEINYSPSRDELKASLKIDSVKKNILKQIKEYR